MLLCSITFSFVHYDLLAARRVWNTVWAVSAKYLLLDVDEKREKRWCDIDKKAHLEPIQVFRPGPKL